MNTFESMQCAIIAEKLSKTPVECYVKPTLENFGILDFHHEKEIRKSVHWDVTTFKEKLQRDVLTALKEQPKDATEKKIQDSAL